MERNRQTKKRDADELRSGQTQETTAIVCAPEFEDKPADGVEAHERDEDLAVVTFASVHVKQAKRGDRKGNCRLVDLRWMHGMRNRMFAGKLSKLRLGLARRATCGERQTKRAVGLDSETASSKQASDAAESKALHALFADTMPAVSGSKGALGHALGAASAIELAVCIQGLQAQTIPPTAGHREPEAEAGIACTRTPLVRRIHWVLNNAFAFGGINSALLLRAWAE